MQRHSPRASSAAFESFLAVAHWPSLDGLRGLAILPVIWHHATPRPLAGIAGKGAVGVDLFFALSGFLITTLLLRERSRHGRINLRAFFARRSLRIFPLYYLVLGAYAVYALLLPESAAAAHFLRSLLFHATYTANWLVDFDVPHPVWFAFSWSLCVEEQFYWVWPILLALVPRRAALFVLMAGAICVDALSEQGVFASVAPSGSLAARVLTSFAAPIGFGSLLALLLDTPAGFALAERLLGRRLMAPLLLCASIGLLLIPATPYLLLSFCLAGLVGAVVVTPSHGLRAGLEHRALRLIGSLSYGAYLLHVTALGIVRRTLPDFREQAWIVFGLGLPLSLLLAAGAHALIERPLLGLRRSLR